MGCQEKKDEREKPLLFKRHKVVRFLISPKKKKVKIEVNNPKNQKSVNQLIAEHHKEELYCK